MIDVGIVGGTGYTGVELLRLLAPHARRMAEAPLEMRYDLQVRPSRFRAVRTVLSLARVRRGAWEQT